MVRVCVDVVKDIFSKGSDGQCSENPWHSVKFHMWLGKTSWCGNTLFTKLYLIQCWCCEQVL